jgi:ADP-ribose pyrophosphatase YjhB (NUDIX family)
VNHSHLEGMEARFCPRCGGGLTSREVFGRKRPTCQACDYVHFVDPKVAVGVVAERDGAILLTKRNHEPKMGCWSFPSGFVDAGEDVGAAAMREAFEETGIHVELKRLLGVYQESGSRVIYIAYAALAGKGEPVPDAESMEVRFFPFGELPQLAFPHDGEILSAWHAGPNPSPPAGGASNPQSQGVAGRRA